MKRKYARQIFRSLNLRFNRSENICKTLKIFFNLYFWRPFHVMSDSISDTSLLLQFEQNSYFQRLMRRTIMYTMTFIWIVYIMRLLAHDFRSLYTRNFGGLADWLVNVCKITIINAKSKIIMSLLRRVEAKYLVGVFNDWRGLFALNFQWNWLSLEYTWNTDHSFIRRMVFCAYTIPWDHNRIRHLSKIASAVVVYNSNS